MKIYIMLTYTGTVLSSLIKKVTKVPYAHVSIGMDKNLTEVYSFGRLHSSNPIFAGFVREYIDDGLYKRKSDTICRVCSIDVDYNQYLKIVEVLDFFIKNKKQFKYDTRALLRFMYLEPKENKDRYVCSQFVAYLLEMADIKVFDKPSRFIKPIDFYMSEKFNIEYEGLLSGYRNFVCHKSNNVEKREKVCDSDKYIWYYN